MNNTGNYNHGRRSLCHDELFKSPNFFQGTFCFRWMNASSRQCSGFSVRLSAAAAKCLGDREWHGSTTSAAQPQTSLPANPACCQHSSRLVSHQQLEATRRNPGARIHLFWQGRGLKRWIRELSNRRWTLRGRNAWEMSAKVSGVSAPLVSAQGSFLRFLWSGRAAGYSPTCFS